MAKNIKSMNIVTAILFTLLIRFRAAHLSYYNEGPIKTWLKVGRS